MGGGGVTQQTIDPGKAMSGTQQIVNEMWGQNTAHSQEGFSPFSGAMYQNLYGNNQFMPDNFTNQYNINQSIANLVGRQNAWNLPQASAWQASQFAPGLNESEQMFGQNAAEIAKMALGQQQAKLDTQFNQGVGMGSGYLNQSRDLAQQTQANLMQALAGIYTNRQNLASQSANQINQFALQGGQAGESSAQNLMGQTMSAYNNPFNLGAGYMQGTPIFSPAMVQSGGK